MIVINIALIINATDSKPVNVGSIPTVRVLLYFIICYKL